MANDLTRNPWLIDTAGATVLHKDNVFISSIVWSGFGSAADQFVISDGRSNPIFSAKGNAGLSSIQITFAPNVHVRNLSVPVLTSGLLSIFLD